MKWKAPVLVGLGTTLTQLPSPVSLATFPAGPATPLGRAPPALPEGSWMRTDFVHVLKVLSTTQMTNPMNAFLVTINAKRAKTRLLAIPAMKKDLWRRNAIVKQDTMRMANIA